MFENGIFFCGSKAWFPYDRPDRPSRLKKCSSDRDDHMETLPGRSQAIANDPDDRDDRSRLDREKSEAIKWKHSQTIGMIGTIEVYPRKHHSRHQFSRFRAKIALEFANFHQNGGNVGAQLFFIYGRGTEIRVPVQQIFKGL